MTTRWNTKTKSVLVGTEQIPCTQGGIDKYTNPLDITRFLLIRTLTSTANLVPDATEDFITITALNQNLTISNPVNTVSDGHSINFRFKDDGTARTLSFGSSYRAIGGSLPTTTVVGVWLNLRATLNLVDSKWDILISAAGGTGDVTGPASSIDSEVALYNGTTGKLLKGGGALGTAAFVASSSFATAAQGAKADTALQPADLTDRNLCSSVSSSAGVLTLNYTNNDYHTCTLTENIDTFSITEFPGAGYGGTHGILFTQVAAGYSITWPASFNWGDGIPAPTMPLGAGAKLFVTLTTFDGGVTYDASARVRA